MAAENVTASPPLTAKLIEAKHAAAKDYELADAGAPGLRLRITPKGAKVFRWSVTRSGRQQVVTIGRWAKHPQPGRVTLAEARGWLERLKLAHKAGNLDTALAELGGPGLISFTKTVPSSVPSLFHSSSPWTPSSAAKNASPTTEAISRGDELAGPGLMSLTRTAVTEAPLVAAANR